ncbi:hypothetical protein HK405_007365 [Cladochytrium tenue]|nr:hypothetical protein HK405_007365 [Cladochytrium tenue]
MLWTRFIVLSPTSAFTLAVISAFGFVFLAALAAFIHAGNEMIVGGKEPIADHAAVARHCFIAAIIYVALLAFAALQVRPRAPSEYQPLPIPLPDRPPTSSVLFDAPDPYAPEDSAA